jgi:release factor glutamine methyltransferase
MTANSIKSLLLEAIKRLDEISDSPRLDAEILLAHCLDKNRSHLHTWPEREISASEYSCFKSALEQRCLDYPVAYILGYKSFWTFELIVTPDVLIPRPETELLVEVALEKIESIQAPKILDLGTGSGAIALALASERSDASIFASDNSSKALEIAIQNARKLKLDNQIEFFQSNWFSNLTDKNFDLIVSNPPYIAPNDPHLVQSIRHEPQSALVAENQGMEDIENIIKNSPGFIKTNGWVLLEHGYDQGKMTRDLFANSGFYDEETRLDLNHTTRLSLARNGNKNAK